MNFLFTFFRFLVLPYSVLITGTRYGGGRDEGKKTKIKTAIITQNVGGRRRLQR